MTDRERALTDEVVARLGDTPDPRLREVLQALVRHLHACAAEVRLTQAEWAAAIGFLTATGQRCDDERQEFVLLSDVLGLSSLVESLAQRPAEVTASAAPGPFYRPGAPWRELGSSLADGGPEGEPVVVSGRVRSSDGAALPGAVLDVWQPAPNGRYDTQDPDQPEQNLRGRFRADEDGRYHFRTVRPGDCALPEDGPVGELLAATGRHARRPAHLNLIAAAPDHIPLTTAIVDSASEHLRADAAFGVTDGLIRDFAPDQDGVLQVAFDITLQPTPI